MSCGLIKLRLKFSKGTPSTTINGLVPAVMELTPLILITGDGDFVVHEPVKEVVQEAEDPNQVFAVVEQMPEPENGMAALYQWIGKNIKYPSAARRMGVEGTVYVGFVVDQDGKITDVKAVKGISAECDKEAERVIKMMAPWKAGKQNGKAVRVKYVLPVKFKLAT